MSRKLIHCKTCKAEIAKSAKTCPQCGAKNKNPFFMKWWVWAFAIIVIIIVVIVNSGGNNSTKPATGTQTANQKNGEVYELTNLISMKKEDIIKKLGKPDSVVYDDESGYNYTYENSSYMLTIMGDASGSTDINLVSNAPEQKSTNQFALYGVKLGDSFDKATGNEAASKYGETVNYSAVPNGDKVVMYKTKEGYSLSIGAGMESDYIKGVMFAKDGGLSEAVE